MTATQRKNQLLCLALLDRALLDVERSVIISGVGEGPCCGLRDAFDQLLRETKAHRNPQNSPSQPKD